MSRDELAPLRARAGDVQDDDLASLLPLIRAVTEGLGDTGLAQHTAERALRRLLAAPDAAGGDVLEIALGDVRLPADLVKPAWDLLGDDSKADALKPRDRAGLVSLLARQLDAKALSDDHVRSVLLAEAGPQTADYGMKLVRYLSVSKGFLPDREYLTQFAATSEGKAALLALTPGWRESQQAIAPTLDVDAVWTSPLVLEGAIWSLRHVASRDAVDPAVVRKWLASHFPTSDDAIVRRLILERFGETVPGEDPLDPTELEKADDRTLVAAFELALIRQKPDVAGSIADLVAKRLPSGSPTIWILSTLARRSPAPPSLRPDDVAGVLLPQTADLLVVHSSVLRDKIREVRSIPIEAPAESDDMALDNLLFWLAALDSVSVE